MKAWSKGAIFWLLFGLVVIGGFYYLYQAKIFINATYPHIEQLLFIVGVLLGLCFVILSYFIGRLKRSSVLNKEYGDKNYEMHVKINERILGIEENLIKLQGDIR